MSSPRPIIIQTTQPRDIRILLPKLRASDWQEIAASSRLPVGHAIAMSAARGEAQTAWCGDDPIAVFGVVPTGGFGRAGCPWLVGTDALEEQALRTARLSRQIMARWQVAYDHLSNYVDARNTASIRWLKWLGFRLHEPTPYGPFGELFQRFDWRR